uniref:Uncharacterized protein n=1 Tax=Hyaloperonospora arabidopsidis (strain Emoy2) TaxID=559515 RepID=M4BN60_HYAAE
MRACPLRCHHFQLFDLGNLVMWSELARRCPTSHPYSTQPRKKVHPEPQQAPAVEEVNPPTGEEVDPPAGEDGDCGDASVSCIGGISARENGVLPPEPRTVSDGKEKLDDEQVAPLNEMRPLRRRNRIAEKNN